MSSFMKGHLWSRAYDNENTFLFIPNIYIGPLNEVCKRIIQLYLFGFLILAE